jgi:5-aminolevulinate synthase
LPAGKLPRLKLVLNGAQLPLMPSDTHIVPIHVGDPEKCKMACDLLLWEYGIYIQPINYPTVPRGLERLRITPSPYHDDALIDRLCRGPGGGLGSAQASAPQSDPRR